MSRQFHLNVLNLVPFYLHQFVGRGTSRNAYTIVYKDLDVVTDFYFKLAHSFSESVVDLMKISNSTACSY